MFRPELFSFCAMQIGEATIHLSQDLPTYEDTDIIRQVQLQLSPVGAAGGPTTDDGLRRLSRDVLIALDALHEADLVHRDVRMANIVNCRSRWILIDLELAGKAGELVWFRSDHLPQRVQSGEPYQKADDLWMLGALITKSSCGSTAAKDFGEQLKANSYASAGDAAAHIW